ncbi:hypothetical protein KSX_84620 [Ktedonospora formicarum]|uniref:Uncharacterized protein n=1 Tax=Ktedonospora formicarum TaxID=2778364 RepID=A0A8J3IE23_9CHLR|nr:hypothetical protein KSX_84620 [Ktedonospora formicarum]
MNFIGEDMRPRIGHFLGNHYISLAETCTRIGHPLPKRSYQTGIDRAGASCMSCKQWQKYYQVDEATHKS